VRYEVFGVAGIPEVRDGDDVGALIVNALSATGEVLRDGDIVVVTSKIVSKAEGRVVEGDDREAAIDAEAVRTVAEWTTPRGRTRIVETRHGLVLAAAGVDASNVESGRVVLLPIDPDQSARTIRATLAGAGGVNVGVIVTDTVGRVWRQGVTDIAIGAAGVSALDDLRGQADGFGNELGVTMVALADEIAAASEPVRGKLSGVPVAVVRGLEHAVLPTGSDGDGATALVRPSLEDRFRLGTPEAMRAAVLARRDVTEFHTEPVAPGVIEAAVAAALTGPAVSEKPELRFAMIDSDDARKAVVESLTHTDPAVADVADRAPGLIVIYLVAGSTAAATASVQNLLISLAAEGVGSVWLPVAERPEIDVESTLTPVAVIGYGYPHNALDPQDPPDPTPFIVNL
jgi:coenzyme F420-0:L-glutamate ligase/coenzyme F420-1:gamma-L-glutamate ligase